MTLKTFISVWYMIWTRVEVIVTARLWYKNLKKNILASLSIWYKRGRHNSHNCGNARLRAADE